LARTPGRQSNGARAGRGCHWKHRTSSQSGRTASDRAALGYGEQVYVLRSVASALGNIVPDAAALCQTCDRRKIHRVTYKAQEANLKIKKEPVPTWF